MIRAAHPSDASSIVDVVVAAEMFTREEAGDVEALLEAFFGEDDTEVHGCVVEVTDEAVVGVAYWEPWRGGDGVWNLLMLGVRPELHGGGIGRGLIAEVERSLTSSGQRMLLVETSGTPQYAQARGFYAACGYDEEARVRDLWAPGDDMVLFRKALSHAPAG